MTFGNWGSSTFFDVSDAFMAFSVSYLPDLMLVCSMFFF